MSHAYIFALLKITRVAPTHWPSEVVGPYRRTLESALRAGEAHAGLTEAGTWFEVAPGLSRMEVGDDAYYEVIRCDLED